MNVSLIIPLLFIFAVTPAATAAHGLFGILNETAYDGDLDIVTDYPDPEKKIKIHKQIQGWIDIVGFENAVEYNGMNYINGSEEPVPVIEYWIRYYAIKKKSVIYLGITDTRIINTLSNGTTRVEMDVLLKWRSTSTSSSGSSSSRKPPENMTMISSTKTPESYPRLEDNIPVWITIYNNSLNPHVDIHTPVQPFVIKTEYTYKNEIITRTTMAGVAATGAVNFTDCKYWIDDADNMSSRNGIAILKYTNESGFDISDLTITAYTPYESKILTNYSIKTVEIDTVESIIEKGIVTHLITMLIFGWGMKKCMSVWGDMI